MLTYSPPARQVVGLYGHGSGSSGGIVGTPGRNPAGGGGHHDMKMVPMKKQNGHSSIYGKDP